MKYIKYLLILELMFISKPIGLVWYWFVFPFRKYARSVVQNYALQGKIDIKRLNRRKPQRWREGDGWTLFDVHNVGYNGKVHYRKVSPIEFWLVIIFIWGWLDDDSNHDTYDKGHVSRYLYGNLNNSIMTKLFRKQLSNAWHAATVYGNTFDLGDKRAENPHFNFIATLIWNTRNTAYNFAYWLEETGNEDDIFLWEFWGMQFGWVEDYPVDDKPYWKFRFIRNW